MTPSKIKDVATTLITQLDEQGIVPVRYNPELYLEDATQVERLQHASYLLKNVLVYVEQDKIGKANRHLAAAQTILSFARFATVAESMSINRP